MEGITMSYIYNDGGRAESGYKGKTGDCVTRAIAIATGKPYKEVYDLVNRISKEERVRSGRKKSSARTGVKRKSVRDLLAELGAEWVPTMSIGSGCRVHLRAEELPKGTIIASLSGHIVAVIDGVIHDTYDPSREGTRCVYGYWVIKEGRK